MKTKNPGRQKNASLRKTYKNQTEANDKVWDLNRELERALDSLALFYERFEQVNSDLAAADKKIDKPCEEMKDAMENATQGQRLVEIASQAVHDRRTEKTSSFDGRRAR